MILGFNLNQVHRHWHYLNLTTQLRDNHLYFFAARDKLIQLDLSVTNLVLESVKLLAEIYAFAHTFRHL